MGQRMMESRGAERCVRLAFTSDDGSRRRSVTLSDSELQPKVLGLRSRGLAQGRSTPGDAIVSCAFGGPLPLLPQHRPLLLPSPPLTSLLSWDGSEGDRGLC